MWRFLVDGDGCIKFSDHKRYLDRMEARSQLFQNVRWSERKVDFPNCDQCVQKMPFLIVQIILYSPPKKITMRRYVCQAATKIALRSEGIFPSRLCHRLPPACMRSKVPYRACASGRMSHMHVPFGIHSPFLALVHICGGVSWRRVEKFPRLCWCYLEVVIS